jgi:hypothetical protein
MGDLKSYSQVNMLAAPTKANHLIRKQDLDARDFSKDLCTAYDPYSRNIAAGSSAAPTPITFYKVGSNIPPDSTIVLDGSVIYGGSSGSLLIKRAGIYSITGRIQMIAKDSDTGIIIQVNGDLDTAPYLNKFVVPKGAMQGQLTIIVTATANSYVRMALCSTSAIQTASGPSASGNNANSQACSLSIYRIA